MANYAAIVVAIVGVIGYLWYKVKTSPSDVELLTARVELEAKTRKALEAQMAAKANEEAKELRDEASKILAISVAEDKRRAALELLAKLRGVH
jgi:hypothetical protein